MNLHSWKSLSVYLAITIISITASFGQEMKESLDRGTKVHIETQDTTLSLAQCLEAAVANYPSIKAKMAEKEGAREELKRSNANRIPLLMLQEQVTYATANAMTGTFWPNEGYALPSAGSRRTDQVWTGAFGQYSTLALTGPIYTFGKIKHDVAASDQGVKTADYDYQNEIFQHKVKVADVYLRLLTFKEITRVQQSNLKRAQDLKNVIDAKVNSGLRPGVDSSFVSAELSKAKLKLLEAKRQQKVAALYLGELTGLSGFSIEPNGSEHIKAVPPQVNVELDEDKNPSLLFKKSNWFEQLEREQQAKVAWTPTLKYMVAGVGRGSGVGGPTGTNNSIFTQSLSRGIKFQRGNYLAGVYTLWNVLEFTKSSHDYRAAQSYSLAAKYRYDEALLTTNRALEDAKIQLALSLEAVHEAPVQLRSAKSAYKQAYARYDSGLGTLPELSENMVLLNRAEADMAIAYNNIWRSVLQETAAVGDFDIFMSQISL